ncbi:Uma2 family endonuclease [Leptothoe spongobia]|uniref:Uma2 family endonuclease n=1 Tax=Leptothoe spongobia TAU-MAC 1115 TaxID=1967444 RepID=A0A947GGC2_9CYAN|nr:Uma2 family endonuclease [Leptothoe spongobia]MBT9314289.1 Uma2 family endonuclease [Leptothoe spongobia TAU-MAC 1115]
MTVAQQRLTLTDYLAYEAPTEKRYELVNGELIEMPAESDINQRIAMFLLIYFSQHGIPHYCLRIGLEIAVSGTLATVRLPDLAILSEEAALALEGASRSIITYDMPPPQLVVEVVSPGQANRDYRHKRSEYAARGIQEYWIVDPSEQQVLILVWTDGLYEEGTFRQDQRLQSSLFPKLELTAKQVLAG